MPKTQLQNVLYLSVLPLVRIAAMMDGPGGVPTPLHGVVEQSLTLFADKKFATEFFPDEVEGFVDFFRKYAESYLTGGHVKRYTYEKERVESGRIVVRVTQYVE
jgi:hypothetical protein